MKGRHLKIDILPMNWKPPNQKVEMGRNKPNMGQRKEPSASLWQNILMNFPGCSPSNPKRQSFDYAGLYLLARKDERPLADCQKGLPPQSFKTFENNSRF